MKHGILVLIVIGVCGAAFALAAAPAAPTSEAAAQPTLTPWLPSYSYPDGVRPDPRLDKPVRFWGAGISLEDLFADLIRQTGVTLSFYPPGDDNKRVRVNLYLNADDPPSLRDVLAQIMWTTDCAVASEETGEPSAPYRYYLLSTSVAATAGARLSEDWQDAMEAMRSEWESQLPHREQISAKLDEYRRALSLPQDELIASYYGVDDHLLAALLAPAGRAAASFLTGLESDTLDSLLDGDPLALDWAGLSAAQREDLQSSLQVPDWGGPRRRGRTGEVDWSQTQPEQVMVAGVSWGRAVISAQLPASEDEPTGRRGGPNHFLMAPMLDLTGQGDLLPDERIAIRRALGETLTEEQAGELRREWFEERRDEGMRQWEERVQQAAEEAVSTGSSISPAMESLLSSLFLYLDADAPIALWEVQQAVASASGLNIVSDAFYQPARELTRARQVLYPDQEGDLTAFQILALSALATEDVSRLGFGGIADSSAGWAWEDAGSFLRFRSRARDLWRAAMLPPDTSAWLDEWLDPVLEEARGGRVDVTLDAQDMGILADSLTDIQLQQGGQIMCGDPSDPTAAGRTALRSQTLSTLWRHATTFRALSSLSDSQWVELRGPGIRVAYDLSEEQRVALGLAPPPEDPNMGPGSRFGDFRGRGGRSFGARGGGRFGGPGGFGGRGSDLPDEGEMARARLVLKDELPDGTDRRQGRRGRTQQEGGDGGPGGRGMWGAPTDTDYLTLQVDGEVRESYGLPRIITVQLRASSE